MSNGQKLWFHADGEEEMILYMDDKREHEFAQVRGVVGRISKGIYSTVTRDGSRVRINLNTRTERLVEIAQNGKESVRLPKELWTVVGKFIHFIQ